MGRGGAAAVRPTVRRALGMALAACGERLRVRKAVSGAESVGGARIPGQQSGVLQVIGCVAGVRDERFRCRDIVFRIGVGGFEQEVRGGDAVPPQRP